MVAANLIPAIKATIRANEIGNGSPYVLSFARNGNSGASFGMMQGDTNVCPPARRTLKNALMAQGMSDPDAQAIVDQLHAPLPNGNPLSDSDTQAVADALGSSQGKALVDAMDQALLQTVLSGVDQITAAASAAGMSVEPMALLYFAPWINMTGAPTTLCAWIGGGQANNVPSPAAPQLLVDDAIAYLQATAYFAAHPKNFQHLQDCVNIGAAQLP